MGQGHFQACSGDSDGKTHYTSLVMVSEEVLELHSEHLQPEELDREEVFVQEREVVQQELVFFQVEELQAHLCG